MILSTKDDSGNNLDKSSRDALRSLGIDSFLKPEKFANSYAIITAEGIIEACSTDDLFFEDEYQSNQIILSSSGWHGGYYSSVQINGQEMSRNDVGINLVLYNAATNMVEDVLTYDDGLWEDHRFRLER